MNPLPHLASTVFIVGTSSKVVRCIWSPSSRVPRCWCTLRKHMKGGPPPEEISVLGSDRSQTSRLPLPACPGLLKSLWEAVTPWVEKRKKVLKAGTAYQLWPARQTPAELAHPPPVPGSVKCLCSASWKIQLRVSQVKMPLHRFVQYDCFSSNAETCCLRVCELD